MTSLQRSGGKLVRIVAMDSDGVIRGRREDSLDGVFKFFEDAEAFDMPSLNCA